MVEKLIIITPCGSKAGLRATASSIRKTNLYSQIGVTWCIVYNNNVPVQNMKVKGIRIMIFKALVLQEILLSIFFHI